MLLCRGSLDPAWARRLTLLIPISLFCIVCFFVNFAKEPLHCLCSHLVSDVTDDIIQNNKSAATYLTEYCWIHLLLLQTMSNKLIQTTVKHSQHFLQISHRNDHRTVKNIVILVLPPPLWTWKPPVESFRWWHHNMALIEEQMIILTRKCIRACHGWAMA